MVLEVCKGNSYHKDNIVRSFGGEFVWDYNPLKQTLKVTTSTDTITFSCTKLEYSLHGYFVYACMGTGYSMGV